MRQSLIYLPGLDGTGRLLHRQPALWDEYVVTCASYDHHQPTDYAGLAEGAARLLEKAAGARPAVVLAESFGGAVALTLALARPDLVDRLVLVNTFAYFPRRPVIGLLAGLSWLLPARPSNPATRGPRGLIFFAPDIPPAERTAWWDFTADVPMSAYAWRLRLVAGLDLRPRLARVATPTVVVAAPNDRVVPPAAGLDLARRLPRARLLRPPVGHAALIHPRLNVARILAELRHWEKASGGRPYEGGRGPTRERG